MPRNHIWRAGLDASGFQSGARSVSRSAQSMSAQVRKALNFSDLKTRVSSILGTDGNAAGQIKRMTFANVDIARQQLEDLTRYASVMQKMGTPDTDETYGRVQDAIQELRYDIQDYMTDLDNKDDKERTSWQNAAETVEEAAVQTKPALKDMTRNTKSLGDSIPRITRGFRSMLSAGLAVRLVGSVIGRLRSIVTSYISQNAQLQAQVNGLKNAMGQALAPAINIVVNAMSALMPIVVGVSHAIGSLIGMLGGKWANATAGANQYANAVGGAGSAQKDLNRQLMSFDEINKLSDSSSGGGGGGGSSGSSTADIAAASPAWLDRFKLKFSDLFSSNEFSATNIGGKLGMTIQAGLEWLGDEGANFDWRAVGQKLRENWDEFWANVNPETFGRAIGVLLAGVVDFLIGLTGLDRLWEKLKNKSKDEGGLAALNFFGGIVEKINYVLQLQWLGPLLASAFDGIGDYCSKHGADGAAGFFYGFANFIRDPGAWIYENFVEPLKKAAEEKFGISGGKSQIFAKIGENCVNGFTEKLTEIKTKATEKLNELKKTVTDTATKIKNAFHFNWSLPRLKLPHLQVTWEPVGGFLSKFLGSTAVPHFGVQWYAKGGILDGAQIFGAMGNNLLGGGEAGREAVLPLDRNTGWMDDLARRVAVLLANSGGGDTTVRIPVILDGKQITEVVARNLRARARATGTAY